MYWFSKQGQKSDILTWQTQDLPASSSNEQIANQLQILLSLKQFEKIWLVFNHNNKFDDINLSKNINKWDMNLEDLLKHEYEHDLWIFKIMNAIKND